MGMRLTPVNWHLTANEVSYIVDNSDALALSTHEAAADAACVGVPDDELGEQVKAVVQLRENHSADQSLAAELISLCAGKLAQQKLPRSVDFVSELPRSHAGKVQRKALRQTYWQAQQQQI